MNELLTHGIGHLIRMRLIAMNEFHRKMSDQAELAEIIKIKLLAVAPNEWKEFFAEYVLTIDNLFTHERTCEIINFGNYGFVDESDVIKKVAALNEAWADIVNVTVEFGDESVALWFIAVM